MIGSFQGPNTLYIIRANKCIPLVRTKICAIVQQPLHLPGILTTVHRWSRARVPWLSTDTIFGPDQVSLGHLVRPLGAVER